MMIHEIPIPASKTSSHAFPITCANASDVALLQAFLPLQQWRSQILKELEDQAGSIDHPFYENPKSIDKVEVVDVRAVPTRTGARRAMFAMLNVYWKNLAWTSMLFLKGPTVAMMVRSVESPRNTIHMAENRTDCPATRRYASGLRGRQVRCLDQAGPAGRRVPSILRDTCWHAGR